MGGFGSGTWTRGNARPRVESFLRLSVSKLYRWGYLAGESQSFNLTWRQGGEPFASIGGHGSRDEVWLKYTAGASSGDPVEWSYRIQLVWTSCNYGGSRPWFCCPHCGRRVATLYAGQRFLCRKCQRLAYASQTADYLNAAINKLERLESRLQNRGGMLYRPKGMHWKTYDRINAAIDAHTSRVDRSFGIRMEKILDDIADQTLGWG